MRRFFVLLIVCVAAGACAREQNTLTLPVTDANVAGTFNLTSANGRLLPYTAIVTTVEQWDVTSDKFVIGSDNTWVDSTSYNVTSFVDASSTSRFSATAGTYKLENGQITFVTTTGGASIFAGSVHGNSLTLLYNGQAFVYSK